MSEIVFVVEEDPEGGFTARALGESIFTEAETEYELKKNVIEELRCHYDEEDDIPRVIRLHYVRDQIITYAKNPSGCVRSGSVQSARATRPTGHTAPWQSHSL
jgi:hypothetical protein